MDRASQSPIIDIGIDEADRSAIAEGHLLTQRMQVHEKTAWMLRSLLA